MNVSLLATAPRRLAILFLSILLAVTTAVVGLSRPAHAIQSDCSQKGMICVWTSYWGWGVRMTYHTTTIAGGERLPAAYRGTPSSGWNRSGARVRLFFQDHCRGAFQDLLPGQYIGDLGAVGADNVIDSLDTFADGLPDGYC